MVTRDLSLLARHAREAIRHALGGPLPEPPSQAWYRELGASFVTLHRAGGLLHGCVGSIDPERALVDDVTMNAVAAALRDPRASTLGLGDVDRLEVEVSVLSRLEAVAFQDEPSAVAALRPGLDGVVLGFRRVRVTFLPQMWPSLPDARTFVTELKRKAGLSRGFWDPEIRLWRYTVESAVDPPR
jgi:AmmeMemoRadiSam system protein A